MLVSYKDMIGNIVCITEYYFTLNLSNSNAVLLVYKSDWHLVTPVELAQTPWLSAPDLLLLLGNQMKNQMSVLEVTNSSAIAKVSFETELQEVGVAYNSNPDTFYVFKCDNVEDVQKQIETAESVGKLIAQLKKNSVLVPVDQLTAW